MKQRIRKTARDTCDVRWPAHFGGLQSKSKSASTLDEFEEYRYLEPGIELPDSFGRKGTMRGMAFHQVAKKSAKFAQIRHCFGIANGNVQFPIVQKRANPTGIVKTLRKVPKAVPQFAIDEVQPGRGSAKTATRKWIGDGFHGNGINRIDSLREAMYCMT